MYLEISILPFLAYTILILLVLVFVVWFFLGGTADAVVESVANLMALITRIIGPITLRRLRLVIGDLLVTLGRRRHESEISLRTRGVAR